MPETHNRHGELQRRRYPYSIPIPPNTAILNPSSNLLPGTPYTAVVEGSADGDFVAVKDTGGTPMATDRIFSFTTAGSGADPGQG